jgi:hypothetical protein
MGWQDDQILFTDNPDDSISTTTSYGKDEVVVLGDWPTLNPSSRKYDLDHRQDSGKEEKVRHR